MVTKSLAENEIELRVFMLRSGLTLRRIASQLGVSHPYVVQVLKNRRPGERLRKRLIEELGFPPDLLQYHPQKKKAA